MAEKEPALASAYSNRPVTTSTQSFKQSIRAGTCMAIELYNDDLMTRDMYMAPRTVNISV